MGIDGEYKDLVFTREQIFLSQADAREVAKDFFGKAPPVGSITIRDRAFLQAALLVAVDKSEDAGFVFDIWTSFVEAAPSKSVQALVKSLAKKTAKRWFKKYIDSDPEVSAVGKSAVQYSFFASEWKVRMGTDDDSNLTSFLVP